MDSLDMAYWCDVETKEGTVKLVEDCLRPDSNVILWRDKGGGGWMRYPSKEEMTPLGSEYVIDKRRTMPTFGSYWALRLDNCDFDVFSFVYEECRKRNLGYGIHQTLEENHTCNATMSHWTLAHPQYWNRAKDSVAFPGHASLAYPEVLAHKLRFADEHIALKPQRIFLDLWRGGSWTLKYEFVKPNVEKWQKRYPGEPLPDDWQGDARWSKLAGEPMMAYLREYGRRCKAAGIEFVIGLPTKGQEGKGVSRKANPEAADRLNELFAFQHYGIDWRELVDEGVLGGVWIMDVQYDKADIWGSLRRTLDYFKAGCGDKAKLYFGVNAYNIRGESYATYAKNAGCTPAEAVRNMMKAATEAGCAGVVYECVDCHCYRDQAVCDELKRW